MKAESEESIKQRKSLDFHGLHCHSGLFAMSYCEALRIARQVNPTTLTNRYSSLLLQMCSVMMGMMVFALSNDDNPFIAEN